MRDRVPSSTAGVRAAQLTRQVVRRFIDICGKPMSELDCFHVEKFSHGGISSGYISPEFWRDGGLDLLLKRHPPHRSTVRTQRKLCA